MITTIKEQRVEVRKSTAEQQGSGYVDWRESGNWCATIRDGSLQRIDKLNDHPTLEYLHTYAQFLEEVIEAIKNTAP